MAGLFLYGSLMHLPLLQVVVGRTVPDTSLHPDMLPDHSVYAVAGQPFAMVAAQAGQQARGVLVCGLSEAEQAQLDFYHAAFGYERADAVLESGQVAHVYLCAPSAFETDGVWDFDAWQTRWAVMSQHAARELMSYRQTRSREQINAMFAQICARAWSKVLAAQAHAGQGVFQGRIEVERRERAYTGYFALDEVSLRHGRFDGSMSPLLERSYFIAGDAALVLPYDPQRDRVLVVEQIRLGPLGRGDKECWQLEPIAGRIDPGESAEQAALREAREEAHLELRALHEVARGYSSPGDSTGYFHIFVGLADLPDDAAGLGGVESEAEDIRARLISYADFIDMAERQIIANTPLALLAYWLAHHRSRLRS